MAEFVTHLIVDGSSLNRDHAHADEQSHYEKLVNNALTTLNWSRTGWAVIDSIRNSNRNVVIAPRWRHGHNAETGWSNNANAVTRGRLFRDEHGQLRRGTGSGTNSPIRFTPETWVEDTTDYSAGANWFIWRGYDALAPGNDREEILLHELVHALAIVRGRDTGSRTMRRGFGNEDEFRAVLVTNIYASERGRPLRTGWTPGILLAHPERWMSDPQIWARIHRLGLALPDLATKLKKIETPFNPFYGNFGITAAMR